MDENIHEVDFFTFCNKCVYKELGEVDDPCDECLHHPYNENSVRPVNYVEDKKDGNERR